MSEESTSSNVPKEYICPLSKKIMKEPVKSSCGHIFDKMSILEWYSDHLKLHACPVCQTMISADNCTLQNELRTEIERLGVERVIPKRRSSTTGYIRGLFMKRGDSLEVETAPKKNTWAKIVYLHDPQSYLGKMKLNNLTPELYKDEYLIGRSSSCEIRFKQVEVSGKHCKLYKVNGSQGIEIFLEDFSTNGTFLNQGRVDKNKVTKLAHLDEVSFGRKFSSAQDYPDVSSFLDQTFFGMSEQSGKYEQVKKIRENFTSFNKLLHVTDNELVHQYHVTSAEIRHVLWSAIKNWSLGAVASFRIECNDDPRTVDNVPSYVTSPEVPSKEQPGATLTPTTAPQFFKKIAEIGFPVTAINVPFEDLKIQVPILRSTTSGTCTCFLKVEPLGDHQIPVGLSPVGPITVVFEQHQDVVDVPITWKMSDNTDKSRFAFSLELTKEDKNIVLTNKSRLSVTLTHETALTVQTLVLQDRDKLVQLLWMVFPEIDSTLIRFRLSEIARLWQSHSAPLELHVLLGCAFLSLLESRKQNTELYCPKELLHSILASHLLYQRKDYKNETLITESVKSILGNEPISMSKIEEYIPAFENLFSFVYDCAISNENSSLFSSVSSTATFKLECHFIMVDCLGSNSFSNVCSRVAAHHLYTLGQSWRSELPTAEKISNDLTNMYKLVDARTNLFLDYNNAKCGGSMMTISFVNDSFYISWVGSIQVALLTCSKENGAHSFTPILENPTTPHLSTETSICCPLSRAIGFRELKSFVPCSPQFLVAENKHEIVVMVVGTKAFWSLVPSLSQLCSWVDSFYSSVTEEFKDLPNYLVAQALKSCDRMTVENTVVAVLACMDE